MTKALSKNLAAGVSVRLVIQASAIPMITAASVARPELTTVLTMACRLAGSDSKAEKFARVNRPARIGRSVRRLPTSSTESG